MNNYLVLCVTRLFFAVVSSIVAVMLEGFDMIAVFFYGGAVFGAFMGMLTSNNKVEDNG